MRLVISFFKKKVVLPYLWDVIADGNVILMRSAHKFNYLAKFYNKTNDRYDTVKFSTYATFGFRNLLTNWIRDYKTNVKEIAGELYEKIDLIEARTTHTLEQKDSATTATEFMKCLNQRSQDMVRKKFGICESLSPSGKCHWTLREIAKAHNVTKERVRQICESAIMKMRKTQKVPINQTNSDEHMESL